VRGEADRADRAEIRGVAETPAKDEADVIEALLKRIEEKLESDEVKVTVGDYIRLVQLHKELVEEAPREIRVIWVDAGEAGTEAAGGLDRVRQETPTGGPDRKEQESALSG
jgi:hypothetical protein